MKNAENSQKNSKIPPNFSCVREHNTGLVINFNFYSRFFVYNFPRGVNDH